MANRTERVKRIVEFDARADGYTKTLRQIQESSQSAAQALGRIDKATKQTATSLSDIQTKFNKFSAALKGFGAVYLAQELYWLARSVVGFGLELAKAEEKIELISIRIGRLGQASDIASENIRAVGVLAQDLGLRFEDAADNVALLAPAFDRLNKPFEESTKFASNFTKALRLYGVDARRSQIVTVQLAQALGSNQLAGDELRSLNENAGALGKALEDAIQQILGTEESLKDLGSQGVLSAELVLEGFEKVFASIADDASKLPQLLQYEFARISNAYEIFKAGLASNAGIRGEAGGALGFLGTLLGGIGVAAAEGATAEQIRRLAGIEQLEEANEILEGKFDVLKSTWTNLKNFFLSPGGFFLSPIKGIFSDEAFDNLDESSEAVQQTKDEISKNLDEIIAKWRQYVENFDENSVAIDLTFEYSDEPFQRFLRDAQRAKEEWQQFESTFSFEINQDQLDDPKQLEKYTKEYIDKLKERRRLEESISKLNKADVRGNTLLLEQRNALIDQQTGELADLNFELDVLRRVAGFRPEFLEAIAEYERSNAVTDFTESVERLNDQKDKLLDEWKAAGLKEFGRAIAAEDKRLKDITKSAEDFKRALDELFDRNLAGEARAWEQFDQVRRSLGLVIAEVEKFNEIRFNVEGILAYREELGLTEEEIRKIFDALAAKATEASRAITLVNASELAKVKAEWGNLFLYITTRWTDTLANFGAGFNLIDIGQVIPKTGTGVPSQERLDQAWEDGEAAAERYQNRLANQTQVVRQLEDDYNRLAKVVGDVRELQKESGLKKDELAMLKIGEQKLAAAKAELDTQRERLSVIRSQAQTAADKGAVAEGVDEENAQRLIDQQSDLAAAVRDRVRASREAEEAVKRQAEYEAGLNSTLQGILVRVGEIDQATAELINTRETLNKITEAGIITEERNLEIYNRLQEKLAGIDWFDQLIRSADPAKEAIYEFEQALKKLVDLRALNEATGGDFGIDQGQYNAGLEIIKQRLDEVTNSAINVNEVVGGQLKNAFSSWIDSAVDGTFNLREALSGLLKDIAKVLFQLALINAIKASGYAGFFGVGSATGNAFSGTTLKQGVYTKPTFFEYDHHFTRFATGGVLGEAGAEAVLPLTRLSGGDLGVKAQPASIIVNVNETPDRREQGNVSTRQDSGGKTIIDVMVDKVRADLTSDITAGRGLGSALERQYGLSRARGAY